MKDYHDKPADLKEGNAKLSQEQLGFDYSTTLFLPKTAFPMRGYLPQREPQIVRQWQELGLYKLLRNKAKSSPSYILHDGPPYANGHIHIGHALNKILKDVIIRSKQMQGYNANLVPGWDCHGLPIEWKIEEKYRSKGLNKDEVSVLEFRQECRLFAQEWITTQSGEFERLGICADFEHPYKTMDYRAEATIASELIKIAMKGQLYRGSKPVMWSVVERTALAEAEVEYLDHESDVVYVKFPIRETKSTDLADAFIVIWTTTPWTLPANRAVAFSSEVAYSLYKVVDRQNDFGPQIGEKFILADALAQECSAKGKLILEKLRSLTVEDLQGITLSHPYAQIFEGYDFIVPLLVGEHVSDSAGTGFVHTAPSHGREDFELWIASEKTLKSLGIAVEIPFPVDDAGYYTKDAPGFGPDASEGAARVVDDNGKNGDANKRNIEALIKADLLFARGRIKHTYPHSWRSKKPVIFRNTPQWFVHMDKDFGDGTTLRSRALLAIEQTGFTPERGQMRLHNMVKERPDWVLSRQRAWGVPIAIFVNESGDILQDEAVNKRILDSFFQEGADAWFEAGARERFLGDRASEAWQQVTDILDVWFDSGSTHNFVLKQRDDLAWPADLYLEGSDQHRGWFQSSLLESCATCGQAPYKHIVTHGFTLDEKGKKMSKSSGNTVSPQEIVQKYGADILRLWVMTTDYWEDQKIGQNILQTNVDSYRKLRNVIRWMLGNLAHDSGEEFPYDDLPSLEKFMLHRLYNLDRLVKESYNKFDFKRIAHNLLDFAIVDLSAFYFDIRKDSLYCDAPSSQKRKMALSVIRKIFDHFVLWMAPMLPFTAEEAWLERYETSTSVHLEQFAETLPQWHNPDLERNWVLIRQIRRVVTGALEADRANKVIGSSLEAAPILYINSKAAYDLLCKVDMAEICITSDIKIIYSEGELPTGCFTLPDIDFIAVATKKAKGRRCARSWRYSEDVGKNPEFPDVCLRDAQVLAELKALGRLEGIGA